LQKALEWGSLPKIFQFSSPEDKIEYLRAYAFTYLKEEIQSEQIVRRLDPFRHFLEVAAQSNGKPINFSKIAEDVGVDTKTVISYFSILEDTLIGVLLHPWHGSVRKQQLGRPKFYFVDIGIKRALDRTLGVPLVESTYGYGEAFEHFVILQLMHLSSYARKDWRFSYLRTSTGIEIDLIIDRPGQPLALVEIKSSTRIAERDVSVLASIAPEIPNAHAYCLSRDSAPKVIANVDCLPWDQGIARLLD